MSWATYMRVKSTFHKHNDGLLFISRHDEEITDTPASRAVLTPDMVLAMFPLVNNKTSKPEEQRCAVAFSNAYFIVIFTLIFFTILEAM